MLFIDYSSGFNTGVPSQLIIKPGYEPRPVQLGLGPPDRPPTSRTQHLNFADPQHRGPTRVCVPPPPVFHVHLFTAWPLIPPTKSSSLHNTRVVGLITNNVKSLQGGGEGPGGVVPGK
jgi:hypothetical protein